MIAWNTTLEYWLVLVRVFGIKGRILLLSVDFSYLFKLLLSWFRNVLAVHFWSLTWRDRVDICLNLFLAFSTGFFLLLT